MISFSANRSRLDRFTDDHSSGRLHVMHKRTQYVALFWGLHCDSDACDFSAIIGWTHELPRDIRLGFCSNCFKRVHVQEICDPNDLDFIVDTRVMRVLIPVSKPVLGLTPRVPVDCAERNWAFHRKAGVSQARQNSSSKLARTSFMNIWVVQSPVSLKPNVRTVKPMGQS